MNQSLDLVGMWHLVRCRGRCRRRRRVWPGCLGKAGKIRVKADEGEVVTALTIPFVHPTLDIGGSADFQEHCLPWLSELRVKKSLLRRPLEVVGALSDSSEEAACESEAPNALSVSQNM